MHCPSTTLSRLEQFRLIFLFLCLEVGSPLCDFLRLTLQAAAPAIQDLFQAIKDRVPASSLAAEKSEDDSAEAWSDTPATTGASTPASASASVAAPAATPASSSAASTTEAKPADS